ncbi:cytochrome P450 [Striga asiatica]|uniref:Cytochrome P450 n=1 Tax=Striga asiatica TaxID=4170 RepID=A0A5A7PTQ9_STRAF|nr:cytochrome P450 [Striga asiatica]
MENYYNLQALMICLAFLVSCLCLKVYHFIWWRPKRLESSLNQQGIRGTPYKPLMGDMKEYIKLVTRAWSKPVSLSHHIVQRVDPFTHMVVQKYGKISFYWSGTQPRLTIMDPKLIKEVLTNKYGHIQKPTLNSLILILTKGLTTLQGEEWAARRRIIGPAFHSDKIKGMIPLFVESSVILIEKWKKSMTEGESLEVDVWPDFQELTGEIISRAAFGSNYEEGKEIFKLQKELQMLVIETMQTLYIPGLRFIPTKKNRRRKELDRKITSMLRKLVETKAKAMSDKGSNNDNLLSLLLKSNDENNPQGPNNSKQHTRLSIDDIVEECKQFYLAGHETTSSLLTWTVVVLAMHPDWQQKARDEVLQLCGDKDPDAEAISHLKVVNMILNEVLRLYPPVIALYQHAHENTKIGNFAIPAGIDLLLPIMLVNRDPGLWGHEAEEFKPERFARGQLAGFMPFGWGPRTCVGQNFAMVEAKVALAVMLKQFSFEVSASYAHAPYTVMTPQPQHGAQIVLRDCFS